MPESTNFLSEHPIAIAITLALAVTFVASVSVLPELYTEVGFTGMTGERTVFSRNWDSAAIAAHAGVAFVTFILSYNFLKNA